jgi:hydrophobe/amphiphile efflux-3 (HAE3) family protein
MLKKVASFIVRHRTVIIILTLALTILFGYFVRNVKMSSNLISLAPEDNEQLIALKRTLEKFGSSTFVMISVKAEDAYSLSTLTKIKKISDDLKKLPEVADVLDPLNATIFKYLFGAVVIKKSLPGGEIPQSQEKIENFKKEMLSEPILKNVVVSENGESLAIYIRLKDDHNSEFLRDKLLDILEPYQGPEKFYMSGRPIIESWVKEYLQKDSIRLAVPIVILVIIVLFINFKSARGIFLPISIMLGSIIWTLGLMGIFDKTITMVGVMLPTLILVISSSYSIHFLNQYFKDIHIDSHKKRNIEKSIVNIGKTIFLAAITTIAGFAALTINKIKPMRELGIFVLIGVFFSMILSLTFLPALLTVLKKPKGVVQASREGSGTNIFFSNLGGFITRRWIIILIIACAIGLWSSIGIPNIKVDTSWERWFKKNSEILMSQKFIKSNYGGISTFNVTFETEEDSDLYFKSLDTLGYVDQVEQWIKNTNAMGKSTSLIGYIKRANQLMNKNDPEMYKLPETEADLLKILLMFKMSEFTKSLNNVITEDFRNANILVRVSKHTEEDPSLHEYKLFIDNFNEYIKNNKFDGIKVQMTGVDQIYVSLVDYLVRSQLLSIAISVIIVFIIITITFRSFVYGVFGLIPIIFGLLLNFGAMSYLRIPLDFITSMIASIAVGLGVDNSIHFLIRFSKTKHTLGLNERIKSALIASGIPIFFTSFTLIAGFSVLLFSSFKPILYFGLLISVTMLGCLIGVIFVLPAMVYCLKPRAIIESKEM